MYRLLFTNTQWLLVSDALCLVREELGEESVPRNVAYPNGFGALWLDEMDAESEAIVISYIYESLAFMRDNIDEALHVMCREPDYSAGRALYTIQCVMDRLIVHQNVYGWRNGLSCEDYGISVDDYADYMARIREEASNG